MAKLIDILARELKVWPEDLEYAHQDHDGEIRFYGGLRKTVEFDFHAKELADDRCLKGQSQTGSRITHAEWQAAVDALNATKVVEWGGTGPPPIGAEIEALMQGIGSHTYFWQRAKVVREALPESSGEILAFSLETTRPEWVDEFRPIRTAEQIAAKQRATQINEALSILPGEVRCKSVVEKAVGILIDSGYAKP